jgi:hypothetical protein
VNCAYVFTATNKSQHPHVLTYVEKQEVRKWRTAVRKTKVEQYYLDNDAVVQKLQGGNPTLQVQLLSFCCCKSVKQAAAPAASSPELV